MYEEKNWWERFVDIIVDSLGYLVTRLALIVSPIPVIVVLLESMNYEWYAYPLVVSIEIIGYALGDKVFEGIRLKVLTIRQSIIPLAIYTVVVEALMLGYRVLPEWVNPEATTAEAIVATAAIFYPVMTLFGAFLYAFHLYLNQIKRQQKLHDENERQQELLNQELNQRLNQQKIDAEIEKSKLELEFIRQREGQKLELERLAAESKIRIRESSVHPVHPVQVNNSERSNTGEGHTSVHEVVPNQMDKESQLDRVSIHLLDRYRTGPLPTYRVLAEELGVGKTTISNKVKELREKGLMNGISHE